MVLDGDDGIKYGESMGKLNSKEADGKVSFGSGEIYTILSRCSSSSSIAIGKAMATSKQDRVYFSITPQSSIVERAAKARKAPGAKEPFNVVMLMMDSMSRAAWHRYLSSTVDYFTNTLGVLFFKKFSSFRK